MHGALAQWHDVAPPADLRTRIVARVEAERRAAGAEVWWRRELVSTGLSVGAGLALMVLTIVLLLRFLPLDAVTPQVLLICGSLWGGAYIGVCRLALGEAARVRQGGFPGRFHLAGAAGLAVVAITVATLLVVLLTALPLASLLGSEVSPAWVTVGGGAVALLAFLISSWGLGHLLGPRAVLQALLAACLFLVAVAPGLLMFCVPFTLGVYVGVLLAVGLGASAGGALGTWLRLHSPAYAQS
jgi:hypothetical protein